MSAHKALKRSAMLDFAAQAAVPGCLTDDPQLASAPPPEAAGSPALDLQRQLHDRVFADFGGRADDAPSIRARDLFVIAAVSTFAWGAIFAGVRYTLLG